MPHYVRPTVVERTYRDADGAVIEYGDRWGGGDPPEDGYSVVSHPERFAPLHDIAEALIEHLRRNYDVEVTDDPGGMADLVRPLTHPARAVRVRPRSPDAAALTFVFTAFPGVMVHAGLLHDARFPMCGCDACDETWSTVADELEELVLGVVAGGFRERVNIERGETWVWYEVTSPDGSRNSGGGTAGPELIDRASAAAPRLDALPHGWAAWR